jgi:uncharacterized protein
MRIDAEQVLCRFHLSNFARHGLGSLYEWIVGRARRLELQGATVLEGFYGMGPDGRILRFRRWSISQERPVIVEVVDEPSRIEKLLADVEPVFARGVITLERAHVFLYRAGSQEESRAARDTTILATVNISAAIGVKTMRTPENGVLLRIFIGESDTDAESGRPLHEALVRRAHDAQQLAGATVLRGTIGYGRHSRIHTAKLMELSLDLPLVIEIVDEEEAIERFLPTIDRLVGEGLVTLEAVRIVKYPAAVGG